MKKLVAIIIAFILLITLNLPVYSEIYRENEAPYRQYVIDGYEVDFGLTMYLQEKLAQEGYEWFLPYAVCQMYQESSCDPLQLTPYATGNDCGLYQIRDKYFDYYCEEAGVTGDILDAHTQINIYVTLTTRRLRAGATVDKAISDWTTGGENRICEKYVSDVMSWIDKLEVRE